VLLIGYCKIPHKNPGLILVHKGFWVGLYLGLGGGSRIKKYFFSKKIKKNIFFLLTKQTILSIG